MAYNLFDSINFARTFIEYAPLTAGVNSEPALSIGSMTRDIVLNAPFVWGWNRKEDSSLSTVSGIQDYTVNLTDFSYLEKVCLTDPQGKTFELKDVLNTNAIGKGDSTSLSRPNAVAVKSVIYGSSVSLRFMGIPDKIYSVTLTYQALSIPFASFAIASVANASGGNTVYTGVFTPASFPVGSSAQVAGFSAAANNGSFLVVSVTGTALTLANPAGSTEVKPTATAINSSWAPIPDSFMDIFNFLFLAEAFQSVDDARAAQYRQRGIAALLSKSEGLSEMQKSIYLEQYLNRSTQAMVAQMRAQQAGSARGI